MIKDYFVLAVRNLRQKKLRSWLTVLGIFISIATIFTLISLSLGLQDAIKEQFQTLGTDKFFIMPKTTMLGAVGEAGGTILTEEDCKMIGKSRGVKDYSYVVIDNAKIERSEEIKYMMVAGIPTDHLELYYEMADFKAEDGRFLREGDYKVAMLGNYFGTNKIFSKPVSVGSKITIDGTDLKVVGILSEIGNPQDDSNIIISTEAFKELFNSSNRVDQVIVQVQEGENVLEVANRVEDKLRKIKNEDEKTQSFTVSTPEELLKSFENILNIITVFLAGIAMISLFVGGVGIANTMYTSVIERTKEIGVMKAIGAENKDVLMIFLIEAGLLGLVGGIVGVGLGMGLSWAIVFFVVHYYGTNLLQTSWPVYLIFGCLIFSFAVGVVSGVFPAWRASKTNVVTALRYE